ncbi:hypothetical protein LEN26_002229 [Aphanomyces euteiches]|nr:hypothetical protein AeMF1_002261 [Aphanomyces euteiches]KAH9159647.1 hypothetical protein LEN26_002229 [Aphanomyces euteiches]KAH9183136.1 hypothetical protein AeNC1_014889 [Aphanomyces euteiches]
MVGGTPFLRSRIWKRFFQSSKAALEQTHQLGRLAQWHGAIVREVFPARQVSIRYLKGLNTLVSSTLEFKTNVATPMQTGLAMPIQGIQEMDTFLLNNDIVSQRNRKQRTMVLSPTKAECMGLSEASQEAAWMKRLLLGLGKIEVKLQSWYEKTTKEHIDIRYHFVQEKVQDQDTALVYCPTQKMIADIFTNALPTIQFQKIQTKMGVKEANHDF